MNKFYLLLIMALTTGLKAHAQEQFTKSQLSYGVHPGTVTISDGQVLQGFIVNVDKTQNQNRCVFYTDYKDNRSKKVYKPSEILAYSIENDQYKSIPYSGNIGFGKPDKHFVYITKPGAITTYVYYATEQQILWQKSDEEPVSNTSMLLNFKKSILKLVGDDTELASKIESKEKGYSMLNLAQIIDEYNTWAIAKK